MSLIKCIVILSLVAIAAARTLEGGVTHRQRGRTLAGGVTHKQRGRTLAGGVTHKQRGREFEAAVADAAAAPEAAENNAVITDALDAAAGQVDVLAAPEALSAPEAAEASEALQANIAEAIVVAGEQPQVLEVQPEYVAEKAVNAYDELSKFLKFAKRHQVALKKFGTSMSGEEAVEHHKEIQKYLGLAFHFAEQFNVAVQEEKAIEAGASPVEVAEIAPEVISGRAMKGRAWSAGCGITKWC